MANPNPTPRFAPGNQHGGRTKGARARLSDKFFTTLQADFEEHAGTVFALVRENDPSTYLQLTARLMPKLVEAHLQVEQRLPGNLDPDSWATLRRVIDLVERFAPAGADPLEIFETIERALVAAYAEQPKPLAIEHKVALPPPPYGTECAQRVLASVTYK